MLSRLKQVSESDTDGGRDNRVYSYDTQESRRIFELDFGSYNGINDGKEQEWCGECFYQLDVKLSEISKRGTGFSEYVPCNYSHSNRYKNPRCRFDRLCRRHGDTLLEILMVDVLRS